MKTITSRSLFITAIFFFSGQLMTRAMVTDSLVVKGPNPKKVSNEVRPVKLVLPDDLMLAQADLEITNNMEKDMSSLYALLSWKGITEEADKEIHEGFYEPYALGLMVSFRESDSCIHECFQKDIQ